MFLSVSVRHTGAHPGEHHHGVSIQISISLGKTFLRISRIRNTPLTWILARVFVYVPPLISWFWTWSIERFWFLFWSILNSVTLKTSNITIVNLCQLDLYRWICQYQKWMMSKGKFLGSLTAGSAMAEFGGPQSVKRRSRWAIIMSLNSDVFERRTSTGSGLFALLSRDFDQILGQIVSIRIKTLDNKIW